MKNILNNFSVSGKTLAFHREKAALTQDDVAKALKRNRITITGWESKERVKLTNQEFETLKLLFKVNTDELTMSIQETKQTDILDHPVIKSLVRQSEYIMEKVRELEKENEQLKASQKKN